MDFFDLHQEMRINQHRKAIDDAERAVRDSKNEVEGMRAKVDRLHLATTAMWDLVSERLGIGEQEFLAKVQEIDLRDGRLDGNPGSDGIRHDGICVRVRERPSR